MRATWPADKVERKTVSSLIPYARNARTHSDEQVAQIAASIKEWGWTVPILIDEASGIIAGHGRVLAAQKLGLVDVPVMIAEGWTEAQKRAYVLADNKLALNAGWDDELLELELKELESVGFSLDVIGFESSEINVSDNPYTEKIKTPKYEPSENKPDISELFNQEKTEKLISDIKASGLTKKEKDFLLIAAERHTVFDYKKIADYYSHANAEMQSLMEMSALVIIDFDKAIENGFVKLSDELERTFDAE